MLRATTACALSTSQLPNAPRASCALHGDMLRATTVCTFSTSKLSKSVPNMSVLCSLTSECASLYNGVRFFTSHLARCLSTCRFSEPPFRTSEATNNWENIVLHPFAHLHLLAFDSFSSLISFFFSCLLFSDSSRLCFSICPYCRKFDLYTSCGDLQFFTPLLLIHLESYKR